MKKIKNFTPMIMEQTENNASIISVFDRLMQDRIIFLGEEIDDFIANTINAQLLYLANESNEPIWLYINSPGGSVYSGLAIYDTIKMIDAPVYTCVMGLAASMAFILAISGDKRYALKNSKLMLHQPLSGIDFAQATDIDIHNKELQSIKNDLIDIIVEHTGQSKIRVKKDCERDYWLKSDAAIKYGAIDEIKNEL
jgi:ATP-dependent Clp protease protease subunit